MTRIVLVRHGQSTWNLEHRVQGQTMEVPLTRRGHRQAGEAGRKVAVLVPRHTALLSSDQKRALQTAQRVGCAIGSTPQADLHDTPPGVVPPMVRRHDLAMTFVMGG